MRSYSCVKLHTMNLHPSHQNMLERLPQSTQEVLNTARHLEQQGHVQHAHYMLNQAYQRQRDLRFLASIAFSLMAHQQHGEAFDMLKAHLDERAPDPNLVILMTEALISKGDFAYAEQYIDYAERLGGAQPRIANLRALLKQRIRERHSGAEHPKDMALDSRIDLTRPEITNLPLADSAFTIEEHANDPTEFIPQQNFPHDTLPHTTALESVPTHISEVIPEDLPTMAASAPPRFHPSRDMEDRTLEEELELPTRAIVPDKTTPVMPPSFVPHPEDVADATIPFKRDLHIAPAPFEDVHDPTLHDAFEDDSMDRKVTSYVSLQANSEAAYSPEVFMPLEESEQDKNQVRAELFGSPQDLGALSPPELLQPGQPSFVPMSSQQMPLMADPAPSFGARPAGLNPASSPLTTSGLSSASELSSPLGQSRPTPRFELHSGDRLPQNANSSLELDSIAPPVVPGFALSTPQPASSGSPDEAPPTYAKAKKRLSLPLGKITVALLITGLFTAAVTSFVTDHMLSSELAASRGDALSTAYDGTYEGARTTFDKLSTTATQTHHPLGDGVEALNERIGSVLPLYKASSMRASLAGHRAYHAAWLEWRYEAPGTRDAMALIEDARELLGEDHELVQRATILATMHDAPSTSYERAKLANASASKDIDFALLMALASYNFGYIDLSREVFEQIRTTLRPTNHDQRQLMLELENMHRLPDFADHLTEAFEAQSDASLELQLLKAVQHNTDLEELAASTTQLNAALTSADSAWHPCFTARVHHALARAALAEQDFPRTLKSLEAAHELCPEFPVIDRALITHFIRTGEHDRAEAALEKAIERSPDALLELIEAQLALHTGDIARHTRALAPLVSSSHPTALRLDASRKLLLGDHEGALQGFEASHAQDTQGGLPMAYTHLIRAITLPARSEDQDEQLTALIKAQPIVLPELQRVLAHLKLARAQHTSAKNARTSLFASAQRAITDFIASSQYEDLARYELCELYLAQRRYESARGACQDAAKINDSSIQGKLARARLELESGSPTKAKSLLLPLDAKRHDFLPLAELLVRTYISQGDFGVAEQRLNKLIQTHPDALVAQTLKGRLAFAMGRYVEASELLQSVADAPSHPVEAQIFLAYARIRTGTLQAVEEPLKKHLSHPIWGGYAWLALGELRRRQKRFDDAEENLEKARTLLDHPYISSWFKIEALTQRALNWQAKHSWQHPQVERYLKQAEGIGEDTHADLNYLLGALELSQKRADRSEAIARFDRAILIDSRHCASLHTLDDLGQKKSGSITIAAQLKLYCPDS